MVEIVLVKNVPRDLKGTTTVKMMAIKANKAKPPINFVLSLNLPRIFIVIYPVKT
jgi:hypothetical protein